ncbi:hypothetical protein [Cytobacillus oceanisediminis]|uniref:hypothetical protein n=1 Tax=Cytobacillus oceanisediminis TaxID=665099 RepID=UPI001C227F6C|nr:hypothetical protein [Cytobacillus oceanisediminis]MBU8769048.1 hypothetical protein [Cytobacillus oceanisediminis]
MQHLPKKMSDMRSAYNRIFRIDTESENLSEQQLIFLSRNKSKSPNLEKPIKEMDFEENQKGYGTSISEKKPISFPLILPPPAVEAHQISQTNILPEKTSDKGTLRENIVPAKEEARMVKKKKLKLPKYLNEMLTPFSPMLSWTPSLPSTYTNHNIFLTDTKSTQRKGNISSAEAVQAEETIMRFHQELIQSENESKSSLNHENLPNDNGLIEDTDLTQEFISRLESSETLQKAESTDDLSFDLEMEKFKSENEKLEVSTLAKNGNILSEPANFFEEDFAAMLEESSSSDNESVNIPYRQDEAFALLLDASYNHSESSSYNHKNLDYDRHKIEVDSLEPDDPHPSLEDSLNHKWQGNFSEESSSYEGEFSLLLKKACSLLDEKCTDTIPLQERFLALLEESSDSNHKFLELLNEEFFSSSECGESESPYDREEVKYNKVSSLLEHFSAMLQDVISNEIPNSEKAQPTSLPSESGSEEVSKNEFSAECESTNRLSDALYDHLEESSSSIIEENTRSTKESYRNGVIVKLPVLIGKTDMEVQIFDCFPMNIHVKHITKMEWSVESLSCKVLLPSQTVFVKGILIADIMFAADKQVKRIRIPISIDQSIKLDWICTPELPLPSRINEFIFQHGNALDHHIEYYQQFSEEITCNLNKIHILWHGDISGDAGIEILGKAILSVDFFQKQFIQI